MTMMGVQLYRPMAAPAALAGVDKVTAPRNERRILAVWRRVPEGKLEGPDPPSRGKRKDLAEAPVSPLPGMKCRSPHF